MRGVIDITSMYILYKRGGHNCSAIKTALGDSPASDKVNSKSEYSLRGIGETKRISDGCIPVNDSTNNRIA